MLYDTILNSQDDSKFTFFYNIQKQAGRLSESENQIKPMDLILCHQTADFDALGAAVGLSYLYKGARIVLTGGAHPGVRNFLALYRDELALIERRSVNPKLIRSLIIVDTQNLERLGQAQAWIQENKCNVIVYDHHPGESYLSSVATEVYIEAVGATTTLVVEKLQQGKVVINSIAATVMALGIHVDTGSLTFEQTTPRDAYALAWLMSQGAKVSMINEYVEPSLSPRLQQLLQEALAQIKTTTVQGYPTASVLLETNSFVPGLSSLTERLVDLLEVNLLLLGQYYVKGDKSALTVIGRSQIPEVNLAQLFAAYGGGGHSGAASVTIKTNSPQVTFEAIEQSIVTQIPQPLTARDLMSSPVRSIRPETSIEQAQRILLRYGHSGLLVVDSQGSLVGVISRRDLDLALHHGFNHAPVKGYMTRNLKTVTPDTLMPEIENIMISYDVGRLPVIDQGNLVGIVTRTDILRQLHQTKRQQLQQQETAIISCLLPSLQSRLHTCLWRLLQAIAYAAQTRGWHLYLVGGAVRDLLLATGEKPLLLQDIDLVVDGFQQSAITGAGVELANVIKEIYPEVKLSMHGEFQTAALTWHQDSEFGSLCLDIATARTEFYPYPAANPEVEASSIRQDLYRRDFTINALAIRLTAPRIGELLDFFNGYLDLQLRQIRVLHANSFIEDPTRIYRAVRFAARLDFAIEAQTLDYIQYAVESGIYQELRAGNKLAPALTTRLKAELKYMLMAPYWKKALKLLDTVQALPSLHPQLHLTSLLWWQIRYGDRLLKCLDLTEKYPLWLARLEILLASLPGEAALSLGQSLQLPKDSLERLAMLDNLQLHITEKLPLCQSPSEVYWLLASQDCFSLIIVAVRSYYLIRRQIWHYLTVLSQVKAPLNGHDLRALGYKPGPQYKVMLEQLLSATIDGEITTKQEAEALLADKIKEG